jgi:hypothetical protein
MATRKPLMAAIMNPFAHFMGLSRAEGPKQVDPTDPENLENERDQREDESDESYSKRMEELDQKEDAARKAEEQRQQEEDARRAEEQRRAEGDDADSDDAEAAAEDKKDDEEAGKRAGRAKGARQRERTRCAAILAAGVKAGRVNMACTLAFDSGLSAQAAIATLKSADLDHKATPTPAAATRRQSLDARMSGVRTPNPGANGGTSAAADSDAVWAARAIAASERARR